METIQVAIAIVFNHAQQVLVAQRPLGKPFAGYWEFPGGKVEVGESIDAAIVRELQEEVNLTPENYEQFMVVEQVLQDKRFLLNAYLIFNYSGALNANEGQALKWVSLSELDQLQFPPANDQIVTKLVARIKCSSH